MRRELIGGQAREVVSIVLILLILCGPATAGAQDGTPAVDAADAAGLQSMLALVPADLPELEEPEQAIVAYANIAAQLDAVSMEAPDSVEDEGFRRWQSATGGLALPSTASQFLMEFRQDFGFDLLQVDQTLEISLPPFNLALYRGQFERGAVVAALRNLGYEPLEIDGRPVLGVRGDFEMDLGGPADYALAAMNYATVLADGTLVFAPARAIIRSVLAVEAGDAPSMAEQRNVAALLPHAPADLASALLVSGLMLAGGPPEEIFQLDPRATIPDIDVIATEMAEQERMPPVRMALLGATTGGPLLRFGEATPEPLPADTPEARAVVALLMSGPAAAEDAVPIIEERLATGATMRDMRPFAELFPESTVQAVPGEPVVVIELTLGEEIPSNILQRLLFDRDLGFVAW